MTLTNHWHLGTLLILFFALVLCLLLSNGQFLVDIAAESNWEGNSNAQLEDFMSYCPAPLSLPCERNLTLGYEHLLHLDPDVTTPQP